MFYKMVGDEVVQIGEEEYAIIFKDVESRRIDKYTTNIYEIPCEVSTVFLMLNHGGDSSKPILFETAIIYGESWNIVRRYKTKKEAIEGHNRIVEMVKSVERGEVSFADAIRIL